MESEEELIDFLKNGDKTYMSQVTIDCVIFGYHDRQLKVLLMKHFGLDGWGLPGGFIKKEEPLSDAANRILFERTSLEKVFLKQFYTFGDDEGRINSWRNMNVPQEIALRYGNTNWLIQRTITIGFYALIEFEEADIKTDIFFEEYKWENLNELPKLLFNHNEFIERALTTMRNQLYLQPIGYNLLPEKFTLPEIQTLYETILNKKLHRRNFPAKLMSLEILIKLGEKRNIGQHRSPFLYMFNKEKYDEALRNGIVLAF